MGQHNEQGDGVQTLPEMACCAGPIHKGHCSAPSMTMF
jgi:hypothetical protein